MLCTYAKCLVKPQNIQAFLTLANTLVDASRLDPGNVSYELCQAPEPDNCFAFVEKWKDQQAVALHLNSEHFNVLIQRISPLLEREMEITTMEVIL